MVASIISLFLSFAGHEAENAESSLVLALEESYSSAFSVYVCEVSMLE